MFPASLYPLILYLLTCYCTYYFLCVFGMCCACSCVIDCCSVRSCCGNPPDQRPSYIYHLNVRLYLTYYTFTSIVLHNQTTEWAQPGQDAVVAALAYIYYALGIWHHTRAKTRILAIDKQPAFWLKIGTPYPSYPSNYRIYSLSHLPQLKFCMTIWIVNDQDCLGNLNEF